MKEPVIFSLTVVAALLVSASCSVSRHSAPDPFAGREIFRTSTSSILDPVEIDAPVIDCGPSSPDTKYDSTTAHGRLRFDVEFLSSGLCEGRAFGTRGSSMACSFIYSRLKSAGLNPELQSFSSQGRTGHNIVAEIPGRSSSPIVVMAYYDGLGTNGDSYYPGADANASGVAALIETARRLSSGGAHRIVLAAVDGHHVSMAGAAALQGRYAAEKPVLVVNLDILGSTLAPVFKLRPDFMICLGANRFSSGMHEVNNAGPALHLAFDYYGSEKFTRLFYTGISDHRVFLERGAPCVMFTSGITFNTNRVEDTGRTLDYEVLARRVELISGWLDLYNK